MRTANWTLLVCCGALAMSCVYSGYDEVEDNVASGGVNAGGTTATTGGTRTSGGAHSGGSSVVGTPSLGGSTGAGGIDTTGGTVAGSQSTGGSTGANQSSSVGGIVATGGTNPVGGTTANAGSLATGGNRSTGGVMNVGGTTSVGGSSLTGGAPQTGGSKSGSVGGAQSTGGSVATGGAPPTGGTTGAGCAGGLETLQAVNGQNICVAKMSPIIGSESDAGSDAGSHAGSADYEIDSTEVTNGQYQAWLNTSPSTAGQISVCSWNTSFAPSSSWPPTSSTLYYPVVYVDWCDAYAYCAGVGKRLCGKIGGGSNDYGDFADVTKSQWYAACTSNGHYTTTGYPYGSAYQPTYCNGADANKKGAAVAVGTMSQCESTVPGYEGIYDLSGNVWEWEDSCNGTSGPSDNCLLRGGAFFNDRNALECGFSTYGPRYLTLNYFGFRCCAP